MMKLGTASVALVLCSTSVGKAEEELNAGQLYAFCAAKEQVATTACRFFILGAVLGVDLGDGLVMGTDGRLHQRMKSHFCIPENLPQAEMVEVFKNSVERLITKYPDDLKSPAVAIVDAAMVHSFPCPRN